jgi:hypothetical protein
MCLRVLFDCVIVSTDEELDQLFRDFISDPDDETNQDPDEGRAPDDGTLQDAPCGTPR